MEASANVSAWSMGELVAIPHDRRHLLLSLVLGLVGFPLRVAEPRNYSAHGIGRSADQRHHERIVHARRSNHADSATWFPTFFAVRCGDQADGEADHGFGLFTEEHVHVRGSERAVEQSQQTLAV